MSRGGRSLPICGFGWVRLLCVVACGGFVLGLDEGWVFCADGVEAVAVGAEWFVGAVVDLGGYGLVSWSSLFLSLR